ncbi:hypothetical protein GR7B_00107 [Vibrio phage vB_VcorM_GR7B]|nr:hypothetical protein GR7B_00107 [Vibrio phage vB_VcorM_GR7B]
MNPKQRELILDALEDTNKKLKKIKKFSTVSPKSYPQLVRNMLESLKILKGCFPPDDFNSSPLKGVYKQGYNHLRSIQQFNSDEGFIESDMLKEFHTGFKPLLKSVDAWLDENVKVGKKKQKEEDLAIKASETIIADSAKFTKSLPKKKAKLALVNLPIIAPFNRFSVNENALSELKIDFAYLGDGNNSDYVVLNNQFVLAIKTTVYREDGMKAVEEALATFSKELNCEVTLVEESPVRQAACTSHLFFWVMEAPRIDYLKDKIYFSGDIEWGLAL